MILSIKKRVVIFINEFKDKNVKKVHDIGCGSGINTEELKEAGFEVAGVDVSENAIFEASGGRVSRGKKMPEKRNMGVIKRV